MGTVSTARSTFLGGDPTYHNEPLYAFLDAMNDAGITAAELATAIASVQAFATALEAGTATNAAISDFLVDLADAMIASATAEATLITNLVADAESA